MAMAIAELRPVSIKTCEPTAAELEPLNEGKSLSFFKFYLFNLE